MSRVTWPEPTHRACAGAHGASRPGALVATAAPQPLGRHLATITTDLRRSLLVLVTSLAVVTALALLIAVLPLVPALLVGWIALAVTLVALGQIWALVCRGRVEVYEYGSVRIDRRGARVTLS